MKKISTLVIILLVSIISRAQQIPKGTILLGGTVGFNRSTQERTNLDEVRSTAISLAPSIGKFYRDNRVAGINLNYSRSTTTDNSSKGNFYGIGFFLRQYLPIGKSFYVFAEENINGQTGKYSQKYTTTTVEGKQTDVSLNVYPGVAYAISGKFQFELALTNLLSLSYSGNKRTENNNGTITKNDSKGFSLNAGNNTSNLGYLSIGAKWFFSKR